MSGFRIKYKVLAISVCLVFAGWAAVSAEEFLPVSEVREGMHGYAKTVVHGTQVETFDVDVLGVMKQKGATGGDLILVKVSGDLIDKTEGIAQGMSGSPVYIDLTYENFRNGRIVVGERKLKLLGIVAQTMIRNNELQAVPSSTNYVTQEVMGLGIVFKSTAIKELVDSIPME